MNFIKRLKRAWAAFKTDEKDDAKKRVDSLEALLRALDKTSGMSPIELFNMKAQASDIAKKAFHKQNEQMDEYFDKVVNKSIDPVIRSLYEMDNTKIPGLRTDIKMFLDPLRRDFGRHVTIFYNEQTIGSATFLAEFEGGNVKLSVDQKIKV